jgi:C_GCAxxG_C_C family probable redox protein
MPAFIPSPGGAVILCGGIFMDSNQKTAEGLFAEGFSCSQSLFAAYAERYGLPVEAALRVSSAFGGGMGRQGEVCGAASGALMALGLAHGATQAQDKETKEKTYRLTARFLQEFARQNGALHCPELLGCRIDTPEAQEQARQQGLFKSICPGLVASASKILDGILAEAAQG